MIDNVDPQTLQRLSVALAAGLIIGLERGWETRQFVEGTRPAGIRTFGLLGLLGGVAALLSRDFGPGVLIAAMAGVVALLSACYLSTTIGPASANRDLGLTTEVAAVVTYLLGAIAVTGSVDVVAGVAVVTTLLLRLKPVLHGWVGRLTTEELNAALKLLLISLVVLPVLPDHDMGPQAAFNPYQIWLMVVLTASLSFAGYVAIKLLGPQHGVLASAAFGGMVSSTAVSASFAKRSHEMPGSENVLAAGILLACGTMFPRVLILVAALQRDLLLPLALPLLVMALVSYGFAGLLWWRQRSSPQVTPVLLQNPLDLRMTLYFGALLVTVILISKALLGWLGDSGVYVAAAVAGMTDVDAVTLSLSRMTGDNGLAVSVAARGILVAVVVNSIVKSLIVAAQGTRGLALKLALATALTVSLGVLSAVIT